MPLLIPAGSKAASALKNLNAWLEKTRSAEPDKQKSYAKNVERFLKMVQKQDPSIDVSSVETELASWTSGTPVKTNINTAKSTSEAPTAGKASVHYKKLEDKFVRGQNFLEQGNAAMVEAIVSQIKGIFDQILKKEPTADLSEERARLAKLSQSAGSAGTDQDLLKTHYQKLQPYYSAAGKVNIDFMLTPTFAEILNSFPREEVLSKLQGTLDIMGKQLKPLIEGYEKFLDNSNFFGAVEEKLKNAQASKDLQLVSTIPTVLQAIESKLSPGNAKLIKLLAVAKTVQDELQGSLEESLTSAFHATNLNRVRFSQSAITVGSETETDFQATFQPGDSVYATLYLGKAAKEVFKDSPAISFKLECQGDLLNISQHPTDRSHKNADCFPLSSQDQGKSALQFLLIPGDKADYTNLIKEDGYYPAVIARNLAKAVAGEAKLELTLNTPAKIKENFTLNLAAKGGPEYYESQAKTIEALFAEHFQLPEAKISDSKLETAMVKEMNNKDFQEKFAWAHIISDWWIEREDGKKGAILRRTISAYMGSELDGKYYAQDITFQQPYSGNNQYGSTMFKAIGAKYVIGEKLFKLL